jgi:hypothetical protein
MFIVYYPSSRSKESKLLKITPDKKYAHEIADRWAIDNGGLRCQVIEIAVLSMAEYPKKESKDG